MKGLGYPLHVRLLATPAGFLATYGARALFLLPDSALADVFRFAKRFAAPVGGGENETTRALADLAFLFEESGDGARLVRKMVREGRTEELADIVRGALARGLGG